MNTTTEQRKQYKGWYAYWQDGEKLRKVFVVNAGFNKTGERILKVKVGHLVGFNGWSGGCYAIHNYSDNAIWLKAGNVQTRKQIESETGEPLDW